MAHLEATVGLDASQALPVVRKIGLADLKDALVKGIDDFRAMPTHAIFLSIIYPVGAIIVAQLTLNDHFHLFFPLAAGFALLGPVAALGLYELSRRRELGMGSSWTYAFGVLRARAKADRPVPPNEALNRREPKCDTNREALPRSRSRLVAFRTRCGLKQTRTSTCQQKPWASFAKCLPGQKI
jgi:hypothetical protein